LETQEQRQKFKKGILSESRRRRLDELGFTWDGSKAHEERAVARQVKVMELRVPASTNSTEEPGVQTKPVKITRTLPCPIGTREAVEQGSAADAPQHARASEEEGGAEDARPTRKSKLAANDLMYALSLQSQLTNYHIAERPEPRGPTPKKTSMTRLHLESLYSSTSTGQGSSSSTSKAALSAPALSAVKKAHLVAPKSREGQWSTRKETTWSREGGAVSNRGGTTGVGMRAGGLQGRSGAFCGAAMAQGGTGGAGAAAAAGGAAGNASRVSSNGESKRKASEALGMEAPEKSPHKVTSKMAETSKLGNKVAAISKHAAMSAAKHAAASVAKVKGPGERRAGRAALAACAMVMRCGRPPIS